MAVTGPAVIDGLELEVNAAIGEFWNANFSVGYLDYTSDAIAAGLPTPTTPCGREFCATANESGAPPGQPRKNMSGGLSYVAMLPGGGAITPRLDLFWTDEVASIQPGGVIDAYTLTNFRVTYETPNRDWSLSYALTNASDEFYLLNIFDLRAFDLGTVKSQPGRPREWSLTFRHNFGG